MTKTNSAILAILRGQTEFMRVLTLAKPFYCGGIGTLGAL